MKVKLFLMVSCVCMLMIGCSKADVSEVKSKNDLLVEENSKLNIKIQDYEKLISELNAENSNLKKAIEELSEENKEVEVKLETEVENDTGIEVHNLLYVMRFSSSGYDTKVYSTPNFENSIYTIQAGDIVLVTKFIRLVEEDKCSIAVVINNELEGYINIKSNLYKDGNFEVVDSLLVDEKETKILKMETIYEVFNGAVLRELPSEKSKLVYEVKDLSSGADYFDFTQITADYKWAKMKAGETSGWIKTDCLSAGRGGPIIQSPEARIQFILIDSNEI